MIQALEVAGEDAYFFGFKRSKGALLNMGQWICGMGFMAKPIPLNLASSASSWGNMRVDPNS